MTTLRVNGNDVHFEDLEGVEIKQMQPFEVSKHKRSDKVIKMVLHESAGRSREGAERTLRRKGLGVHLLIDKAGVLHQYNDLALDRVTHASRHNGNGIGVEIINPYYPENAAGS